MCMALCGWELHRESSELIEIDLNELRRKFFGERNDFVLMGQPKRSFSCRSRGKQQYLGPFLIHYVELSAPPLPIEIHGFAWAK